MEEEKYYCFTFSVGQTLLSGKYVRIFGTYNSTRNIMFESFGEKWAFQYEENSKDMVALKYMHNYTELNTNKLSCIF